MREKFISWTLPVDVVARELKIYNSRPDWNGSPTNCTWPSTRWSCTKKREYKDLTKLIVKFKRRERWEMLKADLGSEYLERVHEAALLPVLPDGQSSNGRHTLTLAV